MKKASKKISLNKKSLVKLTDNQMKNVNGAAHWWSKIFCPSTKAATNCPPSQYSTDLYCGTKNAC
jgi:hypothetical protein